MTTITVTAQHIAQGVRENCRQCPVALALGEAFPGAIVAVGVPATDLWFGDKPAVRLALPEEAEDFIQAFDCGGPEAVEPFSFAVNYPAGVPA